ncbi:MAG: vWA domain-containing protein [Myxococcota bacterium]
MGFVVAVVTSLLVTSLAAAQDGLTEVGNDSADPIGVENQAGLGSIGNYEAPAPPADQPPEPPAVRPREGAVLTAISGVRETDHRVSIDLYAGLAEVDIELHFQSQARHPAELLYRVPLPVDARVANLEVCRGEACRRGLEDPDGQSRAGYLDALQARPSLDEASEAAPIAYLRRFEDEAGTAATLRVAPIRRGEDVVVRIGYVAPAPIRGGVARFTLPARGSDARARAGHIRVSSAMLQQIAINGSAAEGTVEIDPWFEAEVTARLSPGTPAQTTIVEVPCPGPPRTRTRCSRTHTVSGTAASAPLDLVLLLDASASTEGPTRGRMGAAIAALLATAPPGSRVRAVAFGSRAEVVLEEPTSVADAPIVPLTRAATHGMGPATRLRPAWQVARRWLDGASRPRVVLLGDGSANDDADTEAVFREAARGGIPFHVINLADGPTHRPLRSHAERTGGLVVDAGTDAERSIRGRGAASLEERLGALFAPARGRLFVGRSLIGNLRAGEELVWEGESRGRARVRGGGPVTRRAGLFRLPSMPRAVGFFAGDRGASNGCGAAPPPHHVAGISTDAAPVAIARRRDCSPPVAPPPAPAAGAGVPAETVLAMLRRRIVPQARACFRRDRAGRVDYSVRAAYVLELERREVAAAAVEGEFGEELRTCLEATIDTLHIPHFDGRVVLRYPVYTMREAPPPTIELRDDVSEQVDTQFQRQDWRSLRRTLR